MRTLLAATLVLALTGCVVVAPGHAVKVKPAAQKQQKSKGCPPGHTWSDGQCHAKGKGHDPARQKN